MNIDVYTVLCVLCMLRYVRLYALIHQYSGFLIRIKTNIAIYIIYDMIWYDMIWYDMIWYIVSYHIISYHIISYYLRWANHSSRGVLTTVVRRCMWSRNLVNEEALAHRGLLRQNKEKKEYYTILTESYQQRTISKDPFSFPTCNHHHLHTSTLQSANHRFGLRLQPVFQHDHSQKLQVILHVLTTHALNFGVTGVWEGAPPQSDNPVPLLRILLKRAGQILGNCKQMTRARESQEGRQCAPHHRQTLVLLVDYSIIGHITTKMGLTVTVLWTYPESIWDSQ